MQPTTMIVLACLAAVVAANSRNQFPAEVAANLQEELFEDSPVHESSPRAKRGLLLLKKKLLLGALGLKAAKAGAIGAGVAGAIALKKNEGSAISNQGPTFRRAVPAFCSPSAAPDE